MSGAEGNELDDESPRAICSSVASAGAVIVAFEGIDGAGKTTALAPVASRLRSAGYRVELLQELSSPIGLETRRHLREWSPSVLLLAFAADRLLQLQTALACAPDVVLCDRYADSAYACRYADVALGCASPDLLELTKLIYSQFPKAHLTLLFELSPREALRRIGARSLTMSAPHRYGEAGLTAQQDAYARLRADEASSYTAVDASAAVDVMVEIAYSTILAALGSRR